MRAPWFAAFTLVAACATRTPAPSSTALLAHDPRDPTLLSIADGRRAVRLRATDGLVRAALVRTPLGDRPMHPQLTDRGVTLWRASIEDTPTPYTLVVTTAAGTRTLGPFTAPDSLFRALPWVGSAVGYQIFPERFANGDPSNDSLTLRTDEWAFMDPSVRGAPPTLTSWDGPAGESHCCHQYFGGDLQGIRDHLDHLDSLGVTLLYLNPFFSSGSAHGYDIWDHLAVEPSFGDEALLRTLVDEARARGIRLMWDFVPNHVGVGHAAFQDVLRTGGGSPALDWFTFKVPLSQVRVGNADHYATFAGAGAMPKLDTANPAVREYLLGAVRKWTAFGFAGIRVDVPFEVTDAPRFFREFRRTAKALDSNVYLVAELWEQGPEWVRGDRFDARMNYAVGQDVIERFVMGAITGDSAQRMMARIYAGDPEAASAMQFNVIATHDNARLLTKMGGGGRGAAATAMARARQRLASAMLFALPGVPVTFQGDECAFLGTGGGGSGEANRYPMQWAQCDPAMTAHYAALGALKATEPALRSAAFREGQAQGALLAWARGEPGPGELLAVFNAASAPRPVALAAGQWIDIRTGEIFRGSAPLDGFGWRFLRHCGTTDHLSASDACSDRPASHR